MADHFVVYLQQPNRSAAVHRVSSRYIISQLLFPDISNSHYVAKFSDGAVIENDSVEEYELLSKTGGGYPGFISWFKQTVIINNGPFHSWSNLRLMQQPFRIKLVG